MKILTKNKVIYDINNSIREFKYKGFNPKRIYLTKRFWEDKIFYKEMEETGMKMFPLQNPKGSELYSIYDNDGNTDLSLENVCGLYDEDEYDLDKSFPLGEKVLDTPIPGKILKMEYDIENIFKFHTLSDDQSKKMEELQIKAKELAQLILDVCPYSRERNLALTNLEQSLLWANESIARNEKSGCDNPENEKKVECKICNKPIEGIHINKKIGPYTSIGVTCHGKEGIFEISDTEFEGGIIPHNFVGIIGKAFDDDNKYFVKK